MKTYEERCAARRNNLRKMYLAVKEASEVHGFVRFSKHDEMCVRLRKTEVLRILRKRLSGKDYPNGGTIADRLTKWNLDNHNHFYFLG